MTSIAKLSILSLFFLVTLVAATNCKCGRDRGGDHGRDERDRGGDHGRNSGDDHGRHHNRTLPSPTPAPATRTSIGAIVTSSLFSQLLDKNKLLGCDGGSFYTHNAFMAAAKAYPAFGCTGSEEQRKTEIAAFFAQTSAQTAGGGLLSTGYCLVESTDKNNYCQPSSTWSCAPGKRYHGRGALQLKWNYNYGPCGRALGFDGIANPDIVAKDPEMAFKTAVWFWMTPQGNMPSCHDVILGVWKPSASDRAAGRVTASYGTVTNIINGHQECGKGSNARAKARVAFYERLGLLMGVTTGSNVDCYNQKPWATDN